MVIIDGCPRWPLWSKLVVKLVLTGPNILYGFALEKFCKGNFFWTPLIDKDPHALLLMVPVENKTVLHKDKEEPIHYTH